MPSEFSPRRYVIPQQRNDFSPSVKRRWYNKGNPKKRTLIVTINGVDHVYPPKAGVIIFNKTLDKILTVKNRCYDSGSKWGLPKGHLDEEEFPHKCASRELYEETGIKIEISKDAKNCIRNINNTIYYVYQISESSLSLSPIDKIEISDIKFRYINSLKAINKNSLNKELQKVIGCYLKKVKKLAIEL